MKVRRLIRRGADVSNLFPLLGEVDEGAALGIRRCLLEVTINSLRGESFAYNAKKFPGSDMDATLCSLCYRGPSIVKCAKSLSELLDTDAAAKSLGSEVASFAKRFSLEASAALAGQKDSLNKLLGAFNTTMKEGGWGSAQR